MKINIANFKKNAYIFGFKFEMEDFYMELTYVSVFISKKIR